MDTRFQKIWKDLMIRKARTVLTLAGLVIGIWGISSVIIGNAILSHDLTKNFSRTNPPGITVSVNTSGSVDLSQISILPGVQSVENRPRIFGRVEMRRDNWWPLWLFVVEDFQELRVAKFFPESGALPPPKGTMLIERDGETLIKIARRQMASAGGGHGHSVPTPPLAEVDSSVEAVRVQLPGGITLFPEVSGTVFDAGLAPSRMELMIYGYVTRETAMAWMPEGFQSRLLVRVVPEQQGLAQRRQLGERIRGILEQTGAEMTGINYPSPDAHPHQFQINSILFLLGGLGGLALLISAVLVLNLTNSLLTNQIRQIGSLKAIGATSAQVAGLYLSSVFLLGLAASAVALPLAKRAGVRLSEIIAAMMNFDVLTEGLPWFGYAAIVLAGSLFPVAAAFLAVRRWSNVPVRDALENYGVKERITGGSFIDHVRLPLPLHFRLGIRNSLRNPSRFFLSVLTASIGALIFMLAMSVRSSLLETAAVEERSKPHDISVAFENEVRWEQINWMTQFPQVTAVELWQTGSAKPIDLPRAQADAYRLYAVPAQTKGIVPNLVQGRWISEAQSNGVVASHRFMMNYPDLKVGDRFSLAIDGYTTEVDLVGVIKEFGSVGLYMPATSFRAITGKNERSGKSALLILKDKTGKAQQEMISLLEEHFRMAGINVTLIRASKMASKIIRNHLDVIAVMLIVAASLTLIVSGLGMASGISTSVVERTREVGVLRAIGATPGAIHKILSTESLFMAVVAWVIAWSLAGPVSRYIGAYFGTALVEYPFDYKGSLAGTWLCLVIVVFLALVATYGPVKLATRQEVQEAVSYE
jgi:ABC-type antimicrobial peptide transport system permease subunit